ncbi:hypothetical protein SB763_36160, partial [Burkholderia sp. SIMBA_042]|uniref:hypothetical protein n=1 Tax=Burkholderia sp. SIMBA_042 TaxID=3085783 RepID=UPI00397A9601
AWIDGTQTMLAAALDLLAPRIPQMLDAETQALAQSLIDRRAALVEAVDKLVQDDAQALRIRIHGDFHLGQVLVAQGD